VQAVARRLLLVLPAAIAAVVLWAVLTAGAPRPVAAVQVLGGPTRGIRHLSVLLRALSSDGSRAQPIGKLELRVTAGSLAESAVWQGYSNESGYAEVRLSFSEALHDPEILVEAAQTGEELARGVLSLSDEEWRSGVRRQGGWLPGQNQGELVLRVAPARGALAVPFGAEIVVQVGPREGAAAAAAIGAPSYAGAKVEVEL
jgi:hypothetical protein